MLPKDAYEMTSQFALNILAGMEQETESAEISAITQKGRKNIERERAGLSYGDKDEDVRADLRDIIKACDEAIAIMGAVPDAAKVKTNHLSQARYRNYCRTAQEIVQQIAEYDRDLLDKESLKQSVNQAQEELSQLSRSYEQSSDLRGNCEDLRAMLSVIMDTSLALDREKWRYLERLNLKFHHSDLLESMIELLSKIEGSYCLGGAQTDNERKSVIAMAKIDLARELEKWGPADRADFRQPEYEVILQKGVDAIKAINECSGGSAKPLHNTEALKQDCAWLTEHVKSVINLISLGQDGKLLTGTQERSRLNSLPNSITATCTDEQARKLFEKILQVGIDFSRTLSKSRQVS